MRPLDETRRATTKGSVRRSIVLGHPGPLETLALGRRQGAGKGADHDPVAHDVGHVAFQDDAHPFAGEGVADTELDVAERHQARHR